MAGFVPTEWQNKLVILRLHGREGGINLEAGIEAQNEGGIIANVPQERFPAFIPWSAIIWVQLREEPGQ